MTDVLFNKRRHALINVISLPINHNKYFSMAHVLIRNNYSAPIISDVIMLFYEVLAWTNNEHNHVLSIVKVVFAKSKCRCYIGQTHLYSLGAIFYLFCYDYQTSRLLPCMTYRRLKVKANFITKEMMLNRMFAIFPVWWEILKSTEVK